MQVSESVVGGYSKPRPCPCLPPLLMQLSEALLPNHCSFPSCHSLCPFEFLLVAGYLSLFSATTVTDPLQLSHLIETKNAQGQGTSISEGSLAVDEW